MLIDRFINIISAITATAGTIFVMMSVLRLSPNIIAKLSEVGYGFNPPDLENLSAQKADAVSGTVLVSCALLFQIANLLFIREPFPIFDDFCMGAGIAVVVSFLVILISFAVNKGVYRRYVKEAKCAAVKRDLERTFEENPIHRAFIEGTEQFAATMLDFHRNTKETDREFLRRLSEVLKVPFPSGVQIQGEEEQTAR